MNFSPSGVETKRRSLSLGKLLLGLFIGSIIIVVVGVFVFGRDHSPIDDTDLLLVEVSALAQSDNIYYRLPVVDDLTAEQERALEVVRQVDESSTLEIQQAVAATRGLTDQFIAATALPGYQCPSTVNNYSYRAELCALGDIRQLADLTRLRALYAIEVGDTQDALNSSVAIMTMADKLTEYDKSMIVQLVSIALYGIALEPLTELSPLVTSSQKTALQQVVEASGPDPSRLADAARAEYMMTQSMIFDVADGTAAEFLGSDQVPGPYSFHPNRTLGKFSEFFRTAVAIYELPCDAPAAVPLLEVKNEVVDEAVNTSPFTMTIFPNNAGARLYSVVLGSFADAYRSQCQHEQAYQELF